jgi:hypothetical protein
VIWLARRTTLPDDTRRAYQTIDGLPPWDGISSLDHDSCSEIVLWASVLALPQLHQQVGVLIRS